MDDLLLKAMYPGHSYDFVGEVISCDSTVARVRGLWHEESYCIHLSGCSIGTFTFYDFIFEAFHDSTGHFRPGADHRMIPRPEIRTEGFRHFRDLCAGIGGMTVGASRCDMVGVVHVDKSPLAAGILQENFSATIEGDIHCRLVQRTVHAACTQERCLIAAGIPCQPYSVQGLQGGLWDDRGQVLFPVLRIAWLTQASGLVLECVAEIQSHPATLAVLQRFARHAGFRIHQIVLDLSHPWASRRKRWWCVMLLPQFPLRLTAWPSLAKPLTVSDVIPCWPHWLLTDEQRLAWTPTEVEKFSDPKYGSDCRCLDCSSQAPTALHSWGVALEACPCGCRNSPMSEARFSQSGLRGTGIFSPTLQAMRHLHPQEAGLLNTLPLTFKHPANLRAALSMVGQLAAPLQAAWVFAQVVQCVELTLGGQSGTRPLQVIQDLKQELLLQRDSMWLFEPCASVRCISLQVSNAPLQLQIQARSTVADLLLAEGRWAPPATSLALTVADVPEQAQVLLSSVAATQPGVLSVTPRTPSDPVDDYICVFVRDECSVVQHWCRPGTFAFELLPADPSLARATCVDGLTGSLLPIVSRLWSQAFLDSRPRACGHGISAGVVWQALQYFARGVTGCQLLHPLATSALILQAEQGSLAQAVAFPLELRSARLLAVFAHNGHWGCLHLTAVQGSWQATYYDCTPDRLWVPALMLAEALAYLSDRPALPLQQDRLFLPALGEACAFDAMRHAVALLKHSTEVSDAEVHSLRRLLRSPGAVDVLYGAGGLSEEQNASLQDLLRSHGVPEDKLSDRVQQAVAKIGAPALAEALRQKNPWPSLKTVASKPGISMRWILPAELEAHIASRASTKFGTTVPNAKSKKQQASRKSAKQPSLSVDPASLLLAPRSFVASDGAPVAQLAFHEVTAQARGTAFCTAQQLRPFTSNYRVLSVEALGLIATSEVRPEACPGAPITAVRFPAIYGPTGEGVLLTGTLLQLGDASIQLASEDLMDLDVLETRVCRVAVYQDEFAQPWPDFCQAPVRSLLKLLPELTLCQDPRCKRDSGCRRFHPAVEEQVESVVLDVWNRQFQKAEGGKAEPSAAALFSALLRIPSSALAPLFRAAQAGVYFEPRSEGGSTDPEFAVIWLLARILLLRVTPCKLVTAPSVLCGWGESLGSGSVNVMSRRLFSA